CPAAGTIDHFLSLLRAARGVDFGDGHALLFQQSNGSSAIGAEGAGIDGDRRHFRLKLSQKDIHWPNGAREDRLHPVLQPSLCATDGRARALMGSYGGRGRLPRYWRWRSIGLVSGDALGSGATNLPFISLGYLRLASARLGSISTPDPSTMAIEEANATS